MKNMQDKNVAEKHLREHISYPATKEDLMSACGKMSDVPDKDKTWMESNLPEGTYQSAEEVMEAVGWK